MKRLVLIFAAGLLSLLCLFSCGKNNDSTVQNEDVNTSVENTSDDTADDTTEATGTASEQGDTVNEDKEEKENTSADTSKENEAASEESSIVPEIPESKTENTTDNQTAENSEAEAAENQEQTQSDDYTAVWVSSEAVLDGEKIDAETDGKMEMQLALFSDGEYIMAAYFDGEMLENYPQQDKYELSGNILKLASGWQGEINGEKMELSYSNGESTVSFYCTLASSGE